MATATRLGTFHRNHGRNVCLLEEGTVAHRTKSHNNGTVFSEQPIAIGDLFQVKLTENYTPPKGGLQYPGSMVNNLCANIYYRKVFKIFIKNFITL